MTVAVRTTPRSESWLACPAVKADLNIVDRLLLDDGGIDGFAAAVCTHLARSGGKRLRPALVLLGSSLGHARRTDLIPIAAGVELIHLASLYLDDVMDQSCSRRGVESANAKWGNVNAVLAGEYLLAKGTELISCGGDELSAALADTTERLWRGQMRETTAAYNLDLDEGSLMETITLKTASLYEFACRAGALAGKVSCSHAGALTDYGSKLGVLFQLTDDVLDLVADEAQLGKQLGTDLVEGIYTMPVVVTIAGKVEGAERLRKILGRGKPGPDLLAEAIAILRCNHSIQMTLDMATAVADQASLAAARLPSGGVRDSLQALVDFVLNRVAWNSQEGS